MPPPLYDEYEVLKRLKLQPRELHGLLDIGVLAPVARGPSGQPMYCTAAIDRLSTGEQRKRLADALWWDFDLHRPGYVPAHLAEQWARSMDLPFYPFDTEQLQAWARRMYSLKKQCAPFPYPHRDRLERFKLRMEGEATRAFQKVNGIKRPRIRRRLRFRGVDKPVELTRAELRDLVWSKTMILAAADLGISEFALRQICKRNQVPTPPRGHFNHKDPKQRLRRPRLAGLRSGSAADANERSCSS
jgi:hypothetical protein